MGTFQTPRAEIITLSQFEDLIKQRLRGFGNLYHEEFQDCWPSTFPFEMSLESWLDLFSKYLTSENRYKTIEDWGRSRADKLEELRGPPSKDGDDLT